MKFLGGIVLYFFSQLSFAKVDVSNRGLDFGGMYGFKAGNTAGSTTSYPNPLTGATTCPQGYQAQKILGSAGVDYDLFYCYRIAITSRAPDYDFGGLYGSSRGSFGDAKGYFTGQEEILFNPATGQDSCPSGYEAAKIYGTPKKDHGLYFCYRRHVATDAIYDFGGMFGSGSENRSYNNVVTDTKACPVQWGYHAHDALGTKGQDYPLNYCIRLRPLDLKVTTQNHVYFVALNGNDQWSGRLSYPNSEKSDGPLKSLERARKLIRDSRSKGLTDRPYIIFIRGGRYERSTPFVLNEMDSGTLQSPLMISAYPGETVEISGSRALPQLSAPSNGVSSVSLNSAVPKFNSVFINGKRATRARFPNRGYLAVRGNLARLRPDGTEEVYGFRHQLPEEVRENLTTDAEVVMIKEWMQIRSRLRNVTSTGAETVGGAIQSFVGGNYSSPGGYYLENFYGAMDEKGEWFLDETKEQFYYRPLPDENPTQVNVRAPVTDRLLAIFPIDKTKTVSHVHIKRIIFSETDWAMDPAKGHHGSQSGARLNDTAPLRIENASHVTFRDNVIRSVGGSYAIRIDATQVTIANNRFYQLAGGAIRTGSMVNDSSNLNSNHRIVQNRIQNSGAIFKSPAAIFLPIVKAAVVEENTITEVPYSGIATGYAWNSQPYWAENNRIQNNRIVRAVSELSDGAAIYTLGAQAQSVISGNLIVEPGESNSVDYPLLDFGGMFGYGKVNGQNVIYPNPITQTDSCPTGYSKQKILGREGIDYGLFTCYRAHQHGVLPAMDFRSLMSAKTVAEGQSFNCPAGFSKHQVYGTEGVDDVLYLCARRPIATVDGYDRGVMSFGGFIRQTNGTSTVMPTNSTGSDVCPVGYFPRFALGRTTPYRDDSLSYCVSPKTLAYGIYLDEGSAGFHVLKNEIQKSVSSGIFLHYASDNIVENNFIINSGLSGIRAGTWVKPLTSDKWIPHNNQVVRNIIYSNQSGSLALDLSVNLFKEVPMIDRIENNIIYIKDSNQSEALVDRILLQTQEFFDAKNLLPVNPLLRINPWGAYRFVPESPARQIQIENLD